MDRFIEYESEVFSAGTKSLKSNMDRFIAENYANARAYELSLKSNMDRFIAIPTPLML